MVPGEGTEAARWLRERIFVVASILVVFFCGYYLMAFGVDPVRARSLRTPLDDAIPFLPETVFVYAWVYTAMMYPLFVVRCPRLFRRVALGYVAVLGVAFSIFALYPVTAVGFRPELHELDPTRFTTWGVRLLFLLDPPMNLFPSLHLAITTLAALASWKARPAYGRVACAFTGLVAVSICTMKQHFLVDGIAGLALAGGAYAALVHPYRSEPAVSVAYSWRGPCTYLALHSIFYLGFFGLFLSGFVPG